MPQSPQLPPSDLVPAPISPNWFDYPITVYAHHTDFAGIVWHGSYIAWLEEARIEFLKSRGIDFAQLVEMGCNLPVIDLSIRYHQSLRMGMKAIVRTQLMPIEGVKLPVGYEIRSLDHTVLYVSGRVVLVAVDMEKGKILRRLPPTVQSALAIVR
ncbi:acyl-CoA thioesterase [Cyanobacteria bacterium FACHB-DQ100]|nr:acyl-CoA thioesterase [Cyanobacteria bacterium FACHB-DQ100]